MALDVENQAEEVLEVKYQSRGVFSRYVWRPLAGMIFTVIMVIMTAAYVVIMHLKILVMSPVFAVSLDPLFFYILINDQDNKCLQMDKKLRNTVLLLRSLTDIIFVVPFIYKIYKHVKDQKMPWTLWLSFSIINDFLAHLPIPQLLIVVTFYNMRHAEYVEHRKVLNVFILGQYLPRIYRIHQLSKKLQENARIWVKALYNFFLYILASHILGAIWYFFSIQQETLCWHSACAKHSPDPVGCMNTFYCGRRTATSRNITFLNEHCRIDTPDGALPPFNFGIYLDSLKNHNSEHIKFEKKFFYSFWWGLRNLSNFGTNLTTSTYVLENLFAILISIVGLLLFLYLIGNVQMEATEKEEMRQRMKGGETYEKLKDVRKWMRENNFPEHMGKDILKGVTTALKVDRNADIGNPFLILPRLTKEKVKQCLFMKTLKTVERLKDMDEKVLELICEYLKPVTYIENTFVFRMGDPLSCMLLIMEGIMWTYESSDSHAGQGISSTTIKFKRLKKGDFYGEELLDRASDCFTEVPVSSKHVKSQTKVKAFVLMVEDLETIVSTYKRAWHLLNRNDPEEALQENRP